MRKGKKQLIYFIAAALLIAGLAGVYFWQIRRQELAEASATPAPTPDTTPQYLIQRTENDVQSVTFNTGGPPIILAPVFGAEGQGTVDKWILADEPDIAINQVTAQEMARGMYYLSITDKLFDRVDDPAEYGLGPGAHTVTAVFNDGSREVLRVGKTTPARDRYYVMLEGDPALYLIYTYFGDRFFYGANELLARYMPQISAETMDYFLIAERGREPLEFGYVGTDEEKMQLYEQYNTIHVTMLHPYPGRELYYSSLESQVLTDFMSLQIGEAVTIRADDYAEYGLDEPSLTVRMRALDGADFHILFGDRRDDGLIYCKYFDSPSVFLTEYNYVKRLYNLNVFSIIERFIALTNIDDTERITITAKSKPQYDIHINHSQLPPEADEEEGEMIIRPTVNGQEVQGLAFRTYYQRLIGLSYDVEAEHSDFPAEPEITITYHLKDGMKPAVVRLFAYDANFYAVQRDDNPIQFLTNKLNTDIMFQFMLDLLDGKLDRDR